MKKIKDTLKLFRMLRKPTINLAWFKVVDEVMKMAVQVQQHGKPMLTKIAAIDIGGQGIIGNLDIVSIWAGVGEANPIERSKHLKAQNSALKILLEKCKEKPEVRTDEDLFMNICLVLDTFE